MKKYYYLFLSFSLIFLSSCLSNVINTSSDHLSEQQTLKYRACQTADDCIYAKNGCCDCSSYDIAINKNQVDNFAAEFDREQAACPAIYRIGPECGAGTVSCVNNLCEYTEPTAE